MPRVRMSLRALAKSDAGVTALEYGLILAIIAVVIVGIFTGVGDKLGTTFEKIVITDPEPDDEPLDEPPDIVKPEPETFPGPDDEPLDEPPDIAEPKPETFPGPEDKPQDEPPDIAEPKPETFPGPEDKPQDEPPDIVGPSPETLPGGPYTGPGKNKGGENSTFASRNASARGAGARQSNWAGASNSGAGSGGQSANSGPKEAGELFGRDSTSGAPWGQTAMLPSSALAGGTGKAQSSGQHKGARNNSEKTSTLILLLWLCLGIGLVILAWKMVLRTAENKEAEEQMEDWEPASSQP